MRFEYTALLSFAPDTGEPIVIFRPEVRLRIHGPKRTGEFLGLVDTGADNTILPESIAHDLGIPLVTSKGPAATAFGGQSIALSHADIEMELAQDGERLRWQARGFFVRNHTDEETLILGHQGFLEYFTATFINDECALDLRPNSYLPSIP